MLYEIKKLFSSRYMYICISIVVAFFAVFVVNAVRSRNESDIPYETLLSEMRESEKSGDEICTELYNKCEKIGAQISELGDKAFETEGEYGENLMTDYLICQKAYSLADYIYREFPDSRTNMIEDALYHIAEEKSNSVVNETTIKTNEIVIEKYNRVIDLQLINAGNIESTQNFFDNTIWEYALIMLVIMMTVRMFTMDITCGAYKMIFSSKNGQRTLFLRQLISVALIVTVIAITAAAVQLIVGILCFDISDLSAPIQIYQEFEFCPYAMSIGAFLLIKLLCKLIFYYTVIAITAMLSARFRQQLPSLGIALFATLSPLIVITYFFAYTTEYNGALSFEYRAYNFLRGILPQGLLNIKSYFNSFDYINIFGASVSRLSIAIAISILISIACIAVAWNVYAKPRKR